MSEHFSAPLCPFLLEPPPFREVLNWQAPVLFNNLRRDLRTSLHAFLQTAIYIFFLHSNAYILFLKEKITEVRQDEPDTPFKDVLRQFGTMWANMSENDKDVG